MLGTLALTACEGLISDSLIDRGEVHSEPVPEDPVPRFHFEPTGASEFLGIRMLTPAELRDTLRDRLGVDADVSTLPAPLRRWGLSNDASRLTVRDTAHLMELLRLANRVAASADVATLFPCAAATCTQAEITALLSRVFILPSDASDVLAYRDLYTRASVELEDPELARRAVLQSAVFSPRLLYRTELGGAGEALTLHELAAKLAYFVLGSAPDAGLRAAAEDGSLAQDAVYRAQLERLLAAPRARQRITGFVLEWLGGSDLDLSHKDDYATLPSGLEADMRREVEALIDDVLLTRRRPFAELLTAPVAWLNERLATFYGLPGVSGDELRPVPLTGTGRAGVLTTGLVLAAHAKESGRSPMQRGAFVVDALACHSFPSDAGLPAMRLPENADGLTLRDRFAQVETTAPCVYCHRVLNAGFAFDAFDAVGRPFPRDVVDASEIRGVFDLPPYAPMRFEDVESAVAGLAAHPAVRRCVVAQAFRFAEGHVPSQEDASTMAALEQSFDPARDDVFALFRAVALSESFKR